MTTMQAIVLDYVNNLPVYSGYLRQLEALLHQTLRSAGIDYFRVESRIKKGQGLTRRLASLEGRIEGIHEVSDLLGTRVVAYYAGDVPRIMEQLSQVCQVAARCDPIQTIISDPCFQGTPYATLEVRVSQGHAEKENPDSIKPIKVEIQVCTLAQYVWISVSEQVGYSRETFPGEKKREFGQLASMLEVFDNELDSLRNFLAPYKWERQAEQAEKDGKSQPAQFEKPQVINEQPQEVAIVQEIAEIPKDEDQPQGMDDDGDDDEGGGEQLSAGAGMIVDVEGLKLTSEPLELTLKALERFILDSDLVRRMDGALAGRYDTRLMFSQAGVDKLFEAMQFFPELKLVADLEAVLYSMRDQVMNAAAEVYDHSSGYEYIQKGSILFILLYLLMARKGDGVQLRSFVEKFSFSEALVNKGHIRLLIKHADSRIKRPLGGKV